MDFSAFKQRAITEGRRYGEDPLVFIREFAQNSRDAGATCVRISCSFSDEGWRASFEDDGSGMSFSHARKYLFTLYASSKEGEQNNAGRFGVGFWSVLLMAPDSLLVESRSGVSDAWAIAFDDSLSQQEQRPCTLTRTGTRITVQRRGPLEQSRCLNADVEKTLHHYCRYLRRKDQPFTPLQVVCNGVHIDQPFVIDSPVWTTFRTKDSEGAVGLAERPSVSVYSRGLLVWQGTSLDELRYGASRARPAAVVDGLAPVYLLNGNTLSVTQDRRAVVDDVALARLRRVAVRQMDELLSSCLDGMATRSLRQRLRDNVARLQETLIGLRPDVMIPAMAVILVGLILCGLFYVFRDSLSDEVTSGYAPAVSGAATPSIRPLSIRQPFAGAMVDTPGADSITPIVYSPSAARLLRIEALETIDPGRGFTSDAARDWHVPDHFVCEGNCTVLSALIDSSVGPVSLPVPSGSRIEAHSVRLDNRPLPIRVTRSGDHALWLDTPVKGWVTYRAGPDRKPPDDHQLQRMLAMPPSAILPERYRQVVETAERLPQIKERVAFVESFVKKTLRYDQSRDLSARYRKLISDSAGRNWLEFTTRLGAGDCDVKNTVAVHLLRALHIPSRLAIGYTGVDGRAQPGMHAWVEYYNVGWRLADATGTAAPADAASATPVAGPVVSSSRFNSPGQNPSLPVAGSPQNETSLPASENMTLSPQAPRFDRRMQAIVAASISLFSFVLAAVLWSVHRKQRRRRDSLEPAVRRKIAGRMLADAMIRPELWQGVGGLSSRRLIPIHGRHRPMSLEVAHRLARKGKLFCSAGEVRVARRAIDAGVRVLQSADLEFGSIIRSIPGVIDLDGISAIHPVLTDKLPPDSAEAGMVIERADRLFEKAGLPPRSIVPCTDASRSLFTEVNLSGLPGHVTSPLPRRFIAVSVDARTVDALIDRSTSSASRQTLSLVLQILQQTDLFEPWARRVRALAARAVFEEDLS